jgi:peptide/nickel transport system permease protein
MFGYIVRRLLTAVVVLFIVTFFTFALFLKGPTNPAQVICQQNSRCTPEKQAAISHQLGLDRSLWSNYTEFLGGLVHDRTINLGGERNCDAPCLGLSYKGKTEISKDLKTYYPATLSLALVGGALYLIFGVPLGILAARYRGSFFDKFSVGGGQVISSIPYYVLALTAFIYLTLKTQIFPETGYNPFLENPAAWAAGLLLPWLMLGITGAPNYARYMRGQMLETMGEDYVRSAKAKGLSSRSLLYKHSLRAAIVPIITLFGLDFAALLSGTIFTEAIFKVDGIGRWTLESLKPPTDFPILNATVIIFAFFVVVGNLAVDLLYAVLDPRVRLV